MTESSSMRCAIVPIKEADSVLRMLLSRNLVDREFKIISKGNSVIIPVIQECVSGIEYADCKPPTRVAGMSPVKIIKKNLDREGFQNLEIPEKWVRYGSAIVLRMEDQNPNNQKLVAGQFMKVFGVDSVYRMTGRVNGIYRTPSVSLIEGKGGDVTHLENGIRFIFDPEKIMFSPGNVNERVSTSSIRLKGGRILDMFSGIGYFTLPLAKYSGASEITAVDINPEAVKYLKLSAKLNHVEHIVKAVNDDSFKFEPDGEFDIVVMGNFRSPELFGKALGKTVNGGRIILHHLVPEGKTDSISATLEELAEEEGKKIRVGGSHRVKSYSPKVWHFSTTVQKIS